MINQIISNIHKIYIKKKIYIFSTGDYIEVKLWVVEGNKKRLQSFRGIVISIRNRGLLSSFTIRKYSYGVGVERVFHKYSTILESITIIRHGIVRKAKLYYLRNCKGKSAKIKERII